MYNADDTNDVELLRAFAASDSGKHVIEEIFGEYNTAQGTFCTEKWFGGDTTEEPLYSIRYSEVYQRFNKKPKKENVNLLNPTTQLGLSPCLGKSVIRRGSGRTTVNNFNKENGR
ncbi:hypothetical protein P9112_006100 [Eukaryota sp. TZLM1-RC]